MMDEHEARSLLRFVEEAFPRFRGEAAKAAQEELENRYADVASAMEWFAAHHRTNESLQLASSLVPFWMATKRLEDGFRCLDRALALANGDDNKRGRALFDAGYLAFWKGDDDVSSSLQRDALQIGRISGNPTVTALALVGLARIALRNNISEARRLCREALAATEGTEDQEGRSSALHVLAVAAQMAGEVHEARDLMRQRIELGHATGNLAIIAIESNNLSMVERQLGNLEEADILARNALDISSRRGDSLAIAWNLNGLAACAALRGQQQRGAMLVGAADEAMEAAGGAWPPDELVHYNRTVSILMEGLGLTDFQEYRAAGRAMTSAEAIAFALSAPSSHMSIRRVNSTDRDVLLDIWLRSVRTTHTFLSKEDIQSMTPQVRDYLASSVTEFWVLCDDRGAVVGFMGISGTKMESLFLAPEIQRRGGGRRMVHHAQALHSELTVDVNEQNSAARQFYEACGFVVEGRSELDEQGRAFPLLHLRWHRPIAV